MDRVETTNNASIENWCLRTRDRGHAFSTYTFGGVIYCNRCKGAVISGDDLSFDDVAEAKIIIQDKLENLKSQNNFMEINGEFRHSPVGTAEYHIVGELDHCMGCSHFVKERHDSTN